MRPNNGSVAFKIEINEIPAQQKLSQNRNNKNKDNIILQIKKTQSPESIAIANEMLKCQK